MIRRTAAILASLAAWLVAGGQGVAQAPAQAAAQAVAQAPAPECRQRPGTYVSLHVPEVTKDDRIMSFALTIRAALVTAMPSVPAGWTVSITNDPSLTTKVRGHAIVGGSFLDSPAALQCLLQLEDAPADATKSTGRARTIQVSGVLGVYRHDREQKITLGPDQISVTRISPP